MVSRETLDRIDAYLKLLLKWNERINLVARAAAADIWGRHILDSLQLLRFAPHARGWLDMGSGAGFPGLVLAAAFAEQNEAKEMTLVESDHRKSVFLREAARAMDVTVHIECKRMEDLDGRSKFDVVTARALAPLSILLGFAEPHMNNGGACLFHKGRTAEAEVSEAAQQWSMHVESHNSITDPEGKILLIKGLRPA